MEELTKSFGKPICVALYAAFAALAARKKPALLVALLAAHASEYVLVAKKLADEKGIPQPEALANCLAFGFTWWKPIKNSR